MSRDDRSEGDASSKKDPRAARLAEALRANLQRRKAQSRARRADAADGRQGDPSATGRPAGRDR